MAASKKSTRKAGERASKTAPVQVAEPPLATLSRDQLSVFLYLALTPEETRALVKEKRLSIPGFRSEALGDVERCDVIADEIRADPGAARWVNDLLEKAFEVLPLPRTALGPEGAEDLLTLAGGDSALALALWRVLSDRSAPTREAALPFLDRLAAHYFGPGNPEDGEAETPSGDQGPDDADPAARAELLRAELAQLERKVRAAEEDHRAQAEDARRRAEEQREKLQGALREARAAESRALEAAARAREDADAARAESARLGGELTALRGSDAVMDAQRARSENRELSGKLGALETRLERSREREEELGQALERARATAIPVPTPQPQGATADAVDAMDGEADTWLFPVYTREFYDSLERWDRRIQRAAFKQAHLLALDHRHPSLRAIPLEGLPGHYRVRVATDVRLIYRRPERQNVVEILSLIDREDLDRYVRQAKTRG